MNHGGDSRASRPGEAVAAGEPRYPEEFLPLAEAARDPLESLMAQLAPEKAPDDLVFFVHARGDAPAYSPDLSRTTDRVVVGVGTRKGFLARAKCSDWEREALTSPTPHGAVEVLVHLRHEGEVWVAPMHIELRAAGAGLAKVLPFRRAA